jgi:LPXTG-motif cell wall-anchored protein
MEVYPDLHLPTYEEVNKFINRCVAFRKANGMTELPYTKYPTNPTCMLHGINPENSINVSTNHGIAYMQDIPRENYEYNIYVDPDFYVFYPCSYLSFYEEDKDYYEYNPTERSSKTVTKTVVRKPKHNGKFANNLIEEFIALARSFIGHTYRWGAEGEITDSKGKCFDCSGLVTYALKEIGVMPTSQNRLTVNTIPGHELFTEIPWGQMQRGDILCDTELTHVVIYQGNNTIVHAANDQPYPQGGVKESNLYFKNGRCFRAKAFSEISDTDTANTNTGETARQVWSIAKAYGLSDIAAAAILGNAQAESGVNPANLQGSYEKSLDFTDDSYTDAVNNGQYNNFVHDSAGYGLFQFTHWSLKQDLYNEAITGCEGSILTSLFGLLSLTGATLVLRKKRKENN